MVSRVKKLLHLGGPAATSESGEDLRELPKSLAVPASLQRSFSTGRRSSHQEVAEQRLEQYAKDKEIEEIVSQPPRLDLPAQRKYGHHRQGSRGASISLAKDVVRDGNFF